MASSMQMNLDRSQMASVVSNFGFAQKPYKVIQAVSCQAGTHLVMQRGKPNFYKVLSLDSEHVGLAEIKKAYRSMVLQYHPDVCPPSSKEEATKRFLELQMAYETLSDPVSRKMYDYELRSADSIGYGVSDGTVTEEIRRSKFPKAVWEKQLHRLKKRSHFRTQSMKNKCSN